MGNRYIMVVIIVVTNLTSVSLYGFGKKTFFTARSSSIRALREMVGLNKRTYCVDKSHGLLSLTAEYAHSFNADRIADFLFGGSSLIFSGSQTSRSKTDILADYFGLPVDFKSGVCFTPRVTQFVVDFDWYHDLSYCKEGLYMHAHLPIMHAKWDLNLQETVFAGGTQSYPPGYMSAHEISRNNLAMNVRHAFEGRKVFGDMREPLAFGKIFGRQYAVRASELVCALGMHFIDHDTYNIGIEGRIAAPIGNRSKSEFLFETMIGNGHHWEIGMGINGFAQLWNNLDTQDVTFYVKAHLMHLFTSQQKRSFDFMHAGAGSRYMLLAQVGSPSRDLFIGNTPAGGGAVASNQYSGRLIPAINQTTLDIDIAIGLQADIVGMFTYRHNDVSIDWGYNFYVRTKERCKKREVFPDNCFVLKGDAQLYGFNATNASVALNASENSATIQGGQKEGNTNFRNMNVDNAAAAFNTTGALQVTVPAVASVFTSNPPILLTNRDIDETSALLPRSVSHTLFVHVGYMPHTHDRIQPYLGIGGDIEWARADVKHNSSFAQWHLWAKGGFAY